MSIPEDQSIDLLVADPALLLLVSDHFPLPTARHLKFMTQDSRANHSVLGGVCPSKLVHQGVDALALHDLLHFDGLTSDWFLASSPLSIGKLSLQYILCCDIVQFIQQVIDFEIVEELFWHAPDSFMNILFDTISHSRIGTEVYGA